ncbi:lim domain family [Anaeramoeba flamelloides]|uniref:Cysteine-rich protein 1 n=1 Tax=Anaeramoeba flamelloides TaxID=1746091 RepID=A0AAV7Z5B8_9EUKA|nr:lim domain family [Anaeramoeba flamelloides]|eukprot:Anaeramoba_flamelloidesa90246_110.p1 GENE.a90246_110~~a90246_110.p1  ORF type:complete len:330 (-),score=41.34 a90246_110:116-1105(-)
MSKRCPKCNRAVYFNEKITALGNDWHKTCFKCTSCNKRLVAGAFNEHDNDPYCKKCYNNNFRGTGYGSGGLSSYTDHTEVKKKMGITTDRNQTTQRKSYGQNTQNFSSCKSCSKPITGDIMCVDGDDYHESCFKCAKCRNLLKNVEFFKEGRFYYCGECLKSQERKVVNSTTSNTLPRCTKCSRPITGDVMEVDNQELHEDCFCCNTCNVKLLNKEFFNHENHFYCGNCIEQATQTRTVVSSKSYSTNTTSRNMNRKYNCTICNLSITSGIIEAMGRHYHPKCFNCYYCSKRISSTLFYEYNNKPVCQRCNSFKCNNGGTKSSGKSFQL